MLADAGWGVPKDPLKIAERSGRWITRPDITPMERRSGYRILESADAPESGSTQVADDPDLGDLI